MAKTKLTTVDENRLLEIFGYLNQGMSIKALTLLKQKVDRLIKHKANIVAKAKMKGIKYASFIKPGTNKRKFGRLPLMEHDRKLMGERSVVYRTEQGRTARYFIEWSDLTPCDEKGKRLDK